ncbi:MAG: yajC [Proteobacteria bacterium]|nr:yajC [Pseudomonadota bacterium]
MISLAHAQQATGTAGGDYTGIIMMVAMFAVIYFLMIRPQQKKMKEHRAMVEALQKGDEVITQGGITGRITKVSEGYVSIDIAQVKEAPVEITVQRAAVTTVLPKGTLKSL